MGRFRGDMTFQVGQYSDARLRKELSFAEGFSKRSKGTALMVGLGEKVELDSVDERDWLEVLRSEAGNRGWDEAERFPRTVRLESNPDSQRAKEVALQLIDEGRTFSVTQRNGNWTIVEEVH